VEGLPEGVLAVRLKFCGAAQTVTGSSFLVSVADRHILIDCGLYQGSKALQERNYGPFPFSPNEIDAVVLTHAHIDHSGLLPKLVKQGFRGPIYATEPTKDLCSIMLADSAHIQETEVERKNRKLARQDKPLLTPIYTVADAQATMEQFEAVEYYRRVALFPNVVAVLRPSGHMLGAALIELHVLEGDERTTLLFTGDLGATDRPIVPDPEKPGGPDFVIMEATYGDRERQEPEDSYAQLARIIKDTFRRGGNVIIPAFAVERTQDLLYGLNRLIHRGALAPQHVYVDSPLAVEATRVFARHVDLFDEEAQRFRHITGDVPIHFPNLHFVHTPQESMQLNRIKSGAVIISASGMCTAGRIKHHLKHNLWRPESSVVFVGYQAQGSLGRQIVDGEPLVRIHGEYVKVRAQIHQLEGFSAHADQRELVEWVTHLERCPRAVFLVHGEESALSTLQELLRRKLGVPIEVPAHLSEYTLAETSTQIDCGRAARAVQPTLWSTTRQLVDVLRELERADIPTEELTAFLAQAEALRQEAARTLRDGTAA
jgi:metallo-beta-lactamase family protein